MKQSLILIVLLSIAGPVFAGQSDDIPASNAPLAQLFSSALRRLSIDPTSVHRNKDGSFTVIIVNRYTRRAREMGLVPANVDRSSGRALIDCSKGTYRVLTDWNLSSKGIVLGPTGDAGANGPIGANEVVAEIASLMCKEKPSKGARGAQTI